MVTIWFNSFVTSQFKADEIDERFRGDAVTLSFTYGKPLKCEIMGTGESPDGDPLVLVRSLPLSEDGVGHVFACDIVQVEG
jgi:hypothetical protein